MAYMVQQRLTTAVRDGYGAVTADEAAALADEAERCRAWLAALAIEPGLRGAVVEPVAAIESALRDLARERARPAGR